MRIQYLILVALCCGLCGLARAADVPSVNQVAERAQPCLACHGSQGRATPEGYFPRIAGKPAGYLFNQLVNFRDGRRHFPMMVYLAGLQDDRSLHELADYFAAQRLPYPPPRSPHTDAATLGHGYDLVMQGDPARQIPACSACHGASLLGVQPAVPGLLGVSQDYLIGQLGAWRNGARAAMAPDCMATIARRMTEEDVFAVTAWLAAQAVRAGLEAESSLASTPPLQCGSLQPSSAPSAPPAATDPILTRGRVLVTLGDCEACHTAAGGAPFAGGHAISTQFGLFFGPNITADPSTGIGRWTADDFWHALHEGRALGGTLLYPVFPYPNYTQVTREDSDAMFAYLRSLTPVRQHNREHELAFPYRIRPLLTVWRALYFRPRTYQPEPQHDAVWNRGSYLVNGIAHCAACHGARNALGAVRAMDRPAGASLQNWYAPSLLDPREAGLQHWTTDDIVALLRTGAAPLQQPATGSVVSGPMAEVVFDSLQYADRDDLLAMANYLQTLPQDSPSRGSIVRADEQTLYTGGALYQRNCASCHGTNGEGHTPVGPPLNGNRAVTLASSANAIQWVLFGGYPPGTAGNSTPFGMTPFAAVLSDDEVAQVLTYVRQSWGNLAGAVAPSEVTPHRGSPLW